MKGGTVEKQTEQCKPQPTFLKSVVKATDTRATMGGLGKMCSRKSYGS